MIDLKMTQDQDRARFEVAGDIDEEGAEALKKRFQELKVSSLKEIVFDFAKVNYIGSAGIGKLLLFYKNIAIQGGSIRIENISASIYELFMVLKLDSILTLSKV